MTTPSFSVSRMDPIRWSHCCFPLLKTLSLCRIAAIEKAYAQLMRALRCFRHCGVSQECGQYSRFSASRRSTLYSSQGEHLAGIENASRLPKLGALLNHELAELLRDNKPKGCSVDYAASVALPYLR